MGPMVGMGGGMRGMGGGRGMRGMGGGMDGMGGGRGMRGMGGGMDGMGGGRGMRGMGGGMDGMGGGMGGMGGGMGGMGGGMRGMGTMGGMSSDAMQQIQTQRIVSMLVGFDTNRNGMIDAEEAQGVNGQMIENILRRAGVEAKYPVSISKVQEALNNRFRSATAQNAPASSSTPEKPSDETKSADTSSTPLVLGFGEPSAKLPTVLAFGMVSSNAAAEEKKTDTSSGSSASSSTPAAKADEQIRKYAKSLLKDYDKNGNGQLEKEEWSQMKEKYWMADKNHDGVITLDEITEFMIADSGSGFRLSSGEATAANAAQGNLSNSNANRFRSPTTYERLADLKLPDWFFRADADGDGEVSMAEYIKAKGDTESTAKDFTNLDSNNDGTISPQEALKAAKKK
jgi:Ca2+-binding EF-hand superfamily protein